jgi:palmitoyl-protein thioesterase
MMRLFVSACVISAVFTTPIAVFHGFGDACSNAGMKKFTNQLGQALNVYSTCIEIGNGSASSIGMDFKK